ncbi:MAG: SPOR domain-containing protein [Rhodoferax sp.]|nr:SPOR domain-containing protein [Rhodoferax sp.]
MPSDTPIAPPASIGTRPVAAEDGTTALYRAALGLIGANYYLPLFNAFDAAERVKPRWNWAAGLFTLNWLLWRHLWKAALYYSGAVVAAVLLVFGIGRLVFQFSEPLELILLGVIGIFWVLLPGLFGNGVLHADCRRRMTAALRSSDTEREACGILQLQASTRRQMGVLAGANALVLGLAAVAALQWAELGTAASALPRAADAKPTASGIVGAPTLPASAPTAVASAAAAIMPAAASPAPTPSGPTAAVAPAPAPTADKAPSSSAATATASGRSTQGRVQTPAAKPVAQREAPQNTAPQPRSADKAAQFQVNVGLFAVESNAAKAYAQLRAAGLPATTQSFSTSKGPRTRVRVGPFATRAEAQDAVEKIHAIPLDAVIISQ